MLILGLKTAKIPRAEVMVQQRAGYIHGKPPKDKIGPVVSSVMSLTVLGPSGWILSHLDEYKSRD
uniref:Uncharacterized protein n=1 Tax=Sphaeramia orbicularis TaxID=375764 RepID=A0A672YNF0_9TELE